MPKIDKTQKLPSNSKLVHVKLIDSLGDVTLNIPNRYDTSFLFIQYGDCGKSCDEQKYRFQPKQLRITKEGGMIWLGEPNDSIERFTISHSGYFPFYDGDTSRIIMAGKNVKNQLLLDPTNPPIVFDTLEKINDRYFSIIAMEKFDTAKKQFSKRVLAVTTIKNNPIRFQYELLTKQNDSITDNLITNSINLIQTIRISKGM